MSHIVKSKAENYEKLFIVKFHQNLWTVILLPNFGYILCLLNLGTNPNRILRLGKNIKKMEKFRLFWIGKQSVFGCKIGKIKSLMEL